MTKRAIGIDIGATEFRAVQMVRDGDRFAVEKVFIAPMRRSTDRLSDILRDLGTRHGFDWQADVAVAMTPAEVFYREITVEPEDLERIGQGDLTPLAESLPVPTDQAIAQICRHRPVQDGRQSILVAATTRAALDTLLQTLVHTQPKLVDAEAFALCSAVTANHPGAAGGRAVVVSPRGDHLILTVLDEGLALFVRSMPCTSVADHEVPTLLADAVRATYQKVFGCPINGDGAVYVVTGRTADPNGVETLQHILGCPVTAVDPFARVAGPDDRDDLAEIVLAEGLAIRALASRQTCGVDFLAIGGQGHRAKANLRRELILCVTLACAIGMVWLIGVWTQASSLESQYGRIKGQMADLFHKTLPDEKQIVSPLAQVQQRLDRIQRDYRSMADLQGTASVTILDRLGASREGVADVVIQDLLITADHVRVQGVCRSFEQVYQWQRRLEAVPGFKKVRVEQPSQDGQKGQVSFTMSISLIQEADHDRS